MKWQIGLADGWRRLHRKGTVIFGWIFTTVAGLGPLIAQAWGSMPSELKAVIPQNVQQWIAYTILGAMFIALRYTTLRKKEEGGGDAGA